MATDIFLSYARQDTSRASELVTALGDEGWSIWWDRRIYAGHDFEAEIDNALAEATIVIVLWTNFSISSDWVRAEAREAKDLNKLLPVLLDEVRTPLSFRSLSTVNLLDWPETKSSLELHNLKLAISQLLEQKPEPSETRTNKTNPNTDPTLSMRVANRVADVVNKEISDRAESDKLRWKLSLESFVNDMCMELIGFESFPEAHYLEERLIRLGDTLGAGTVVKAAVDFDTFSIQSAQTLKGKLNPERNSARVGELINEYCFEDNDFNLDYTSVTWRYQEVLCFALPKNGSVREFIWFLDPEPLSFWEEEVETKLLQLTTFLTKIRSLANERKP